MIKISFVGDIMCLKAQNEASMRKYGKLNFYPQFAACKHLFDNSNYVVGNLETPIVPSRPTTEFDIRFNSSVEFLEAIKDLGIDFVSLANNHILDQGIDGLIETIKYVEQQGLNYSGAYKDVYDSENIFVKEINGIRLAILCFTFGTNSQINGILLEDNQLSYVDLLNKQKKRPKYWEPNPNAVCEQYIADEISIAAATNNQNKIFHDRLKEKISQAKKLADYVIVMPHMGGQYNPYPGNYAKWMMSFIKECGANMIIAGHPHVPQKCISQDDVFECYSLGNFACTPNTGWFLPNSFSEYGVVLHNYLDDRNMSLAKVTFTIVKSIMDEDGYTTITPVNELYNFLPALERERLMIDCEEIISRIRGYNDNENTIEDEMRLK